MTNETRQRSRGLRFVFGLLRALRRIVMVIFGALSAIGSVSGKPALPPDISVPPDDYRP